MQHFDADAPEAVRPAYATRAANSRAASSREREQPRRFAVRAFLGGLSRIPDLAHVEGFEHGREAAVVVRMRMREHDEVEPTHAPRREQRDQRSRPWVREPSAPI